MPDIVKLERTDSSNPAFQKMVKLLDADLATRDGDDHTFYAQFNKIDKIKNAVVLFKNNEAIGCGAFKEYGPLVVEIKRMYVTPEQRGKGYALQILTSLENWAYELGYKTCLLETGLRQPEAIQLYKKAGYSNIDNYGQYAGVENSVCMQKALP